MTRRALVLFGATGFTGALVAEYLARNAPGLSWAIAGRDARRLRQVADRLPHAPEILTADAMNPEQIEALVAETQVVCTTVGPYARFGSALVAACARHGTACCDLTGESQWMHAMIQAHQATAVESGACIVHACGFDSIPSDVGADLAAKAHQRRFGARPQTITLYVRRVRGGVSGGTLASMTTLMEAAAADRAVRRVLADPYALLPDGAARGPKVSDTGGVAWDDAERSWTGPFVMAAANAKVVRRSIALRDPAGNADLLYEERSSFGAGAGRLATAAAMAGGLGAFALAMSTAPGRRWISPWLPQPGEGPDAAARAAGGFEIDVVARSAAGEARVRVTGDQDPGYGATSGMLSEAALALLTRQGPGGFWTPSTAFGPSFVDGLARAGVRFTEID